MDKTQEFDLEERTSWFAVAVPDRRADARTIGQEGRDMALIFGAALRSLDRKRERM
jgi:hypothetical protein